MMGLEDFMRVQRAQQQLSEIAEDARLARAMLALAVFGPLFDVVELAWVEAVR